MHSLVLFTRERLLLLQVLRSASLLGWVHLIQIVWRQASRSSHARLLLVGADELAVQMLARVVALGELVSVMQRVLLARSLLRIDYFLVASLDVLKVAVGTVAAESHDPHVLRLVELHRVLVVFNLNFIRIVHEGGASSKVTEDGSWPASPVR